MQSSYRSGSYRSDGYRSDGYRSDGYRKDSYRKCAHNDVPISAARWDTPVVTHYCCMAM